MVLYINFSEIIKRHDGDKIDKQRLPKTGSKEAKVLGWHLSLSWSWKTKTTKELKLQFDPSHKKIDHQANNNQLLAKIADYNV